METISSANRFRRTLRSLTSTEADSSGNSTQRQRPEKEQCLFDIYKKEGDNFFLKRKHKKAVSSYSLALTQQAKSLPVLVARARCYAKLGQWQHALRDAEAALDIDSAHTPALYQKAQVLYSMEHYDAALLFFHKGQRLNPNAPGFSEGVEKAQRALSHLPPGRRMKTTEVGDISMYLPRRANFTRRYKPLQNCSADKEPEQEPLSPSFRSRQVCKLVSLELQKKGPGSLDRVSQTCQHDSGTRVPKVRGSNPSSMRDVLSQLYTDKAYFEKILHDMERSDRFQEDVLHLAGDGLAFVAERMLYWATFGTPAPPPCASGSRFKSRKAKHAGSHGLQPVLSARQGRCAPVTSVEGHGMTSEPGEGEMTSGGAGDREAKAVTWGGVPEESRTNNSQDLEADVDEHRKRIGKVQLDGAKGRNSDGQRGKKQAGRKRGKKKPAAGGDKEDNATPLSDSDVENLKFNFDTYRPSPVGSRQQAQRGGVVPPPLVRTVEDLSTDEWDSEWDECQETDHTLPSYRRHPGGEGGTAMKNQVTVEGEDDLKEENPDPVRLYLLRVIRDIHAEFDKGGYLMVREKVYGVLVDLDKYKSEFMADKMDLVATLHSLLGNAYLEIGDLDLAMEHHHQDLRIGQETKDNSIVSRALGNLGRINVARKHFSAALECFAGKSKHISTPVEKAWLYQEIANCFLKLRHFEFARDAAAKALGIATLARCSLYQLQAAVLLALSEVQLQKYEQAHEHFTLALDQATLREDVKAESSIRSALHQVNAKLAAVARDTQAATLSRPTATDRGKSLMKNSSEDDRDPELADLKNSSEGEEDEEELADLKDSDTESVGNQEQQVIQAVSALVALSAKSTRQLSPPPRTQDPSTEDSEDLVLKDKAASNPQPGELQSSSSPRHGSNLQTSDLQGLNEETEERDGNNERTLTKDDDRVDTAEKEADGDKEEKKEDEDEEGEDGEEEEEEERKPSVDPVVLHLRTELRGIEDALKAEDAEGVMVKAQAALDSYTEEELQEEEYLPLVAKLHSFLGTAAMMGEDSEKALHHHQKDLDIGQLIKNEEIQSRALENLGRVHVMRKLYDKALQSYVRRLELERDDASSARVFHEIANCFFHVQHYREAQDAARLAVTHGGQCGNSLIQLQSTVLLAVCHVKQDRSEPACSTFEQALQFALQRDDQEAEEAIRDALRRLKSKVQLAVDKFKQSLVRGRRMANKFYPLTDWVSHVLLSKETGQGQSLLKGSGFVLTDKEPPRWRH